MKPTGMPIARTRSTSAAARTVPSAVAAQQAELLGRDRLQQRRDDERADVRLLEAALDDLLEHRALQPVGQLADMPGRPSSTGSSRRPSPISSPAGISTNANSSCARTRSRQRQPQRLAVRRRVARPLQRERAGPSATFGPRSRSPRFHASAAASSGANSSPVSSTTATRRGVWFACRSTTRCSSHRAAEEDRHQHDADEESPRADGGDELGRRDDEDPTHSGPPAALRASAARCGRRCRAATAARPRSGGPACAPPAPRATPAGRR